MGSWGPGVEADGSGLDDERGRFLLMENEDTKVVANRLLHPAFCLRAGKRFDSDALILPRTVLADAA